MNALDHKGPPSQSTSRKVQRKGEIWKFKRGLTENRLRYQDKWSGAGRAGPQENPSEWRAPKVGKESTSVRNTQPSQRTHRMAVPVPSEVTPLRWGRLLWLTFRRRAFWESLLKASAGSKRKIFVGHWRRLASSPLHRVPGPPVMWLQYDVFCLILLFCFSTRNFWGRAFRLTISRD